MGKNARVEFVAGHRSNWRELCVRNRSGFEGDDENCEVIEVVVEGSIEEDVWRNLGRERLGKGGGI